METEVMTVEAGLAGRTVLGPMKAADIIAHVKLVEEIKNAVMKEGTHYGTIPGCNKPSLYKPGAEMLLMAFRLCSDHEITMKELGDGHREYLTRTYIKTAGGLQLAVGIGICSTMETKYRYRIEGRKCPDCGKESIIKGKEEFGGGWICFKKKDGCGAKFEEGDDRIESQKGGKVENPDIADVYHTVAQMSKKRSLVCGARTATACSDFFTQDIEDLKREADRVEKEEHGSVDMWLRKVAGCMTHEEVKSVRTEAFGWIPDLEKRNRITAACLKRSDEINAEAGDAPTPPPKPLNRKKATMGDVVAQSKAAAAKPAPAADPPPSSDEREDREADEVEFDALMKRLRTAESEMTADAVEAAYKNAGVSSSIEDYGSLERSALVALVESVEATKKRVDEAAAAPKTKETGKWSEKQQIQLVALARMDKATSYAKTLARLKISTATKPSEMTEVTRLAVIFDAFGANPPTPT